MRIAYGTESSLTVKSFPLKKYDIFNAKVDDIETYIDKEVFKQLLAIGNDKILHLTVANLTYNVTCYNIYYVVKKASDTHIATADDGDNLTVLDLSLDCFTQRCDLNIYYNTTKDRFEQVFKKNPSKELCVWAGWNLFEVNDGDAVNEQTMITKAQFDIAWEHLMSTVDNVNISFRFGNGRCTPIFIYAVQETVDAGTEWRKIQFVALQPVGNGIDFIGTTGLAYYEYKYNTIDGSWATVVKKPLTQIMSQAQYDALPGKDPRVTYYTTG